MKIGRGAMDGQPAVAAAPGAVPDGLPPGSRIETGALPAAGELLRIPADQPGELLSTLVDWAAGSGPASAPVVIELYGGLVVWTPQRAAVAAPAGRVEKATGAVCEFAATAAELAAIEREVAAAWQDYETDLPAGFTGSSDSRRVLELEARYRRSMSLAGRLSRLSPRIHLPAEHPPTLAGQFGERLRDRCRLADREEFIDDQLEAIIRLYETCAQRTSDRLLAHREYVLIWVIVLLLAAEMVLLLVDLLAAAGG